MKKATMEKAAEEIMVDAAVLEQLSRTAIRRLTDSCRPEINLRPDEKKLSAVFVRVVRQLLLTRGEFAEDKFIEADDRIEELLSDLNENVIEFTDSLNR